MTFGMNRGPRLGPCNPDGTDTRGHSIDPGGISALSLSLDGLPPEDIVVHVDGLPVQCGELFARYGQAFRLPSGWDQGFGRATKVSETVGESA